MSVTREEFVDGAFEEPADEVESAVARVVAEVLGVDRIGRADSFYDFGGTSLAAIKICARLERECGWQAEPTWLFLTDVIADFAQRVRAGSAAAAVVTETAVTETVVAQTVVAQTAVAET
jgi:acyl carrier protein